MPAGTYEEYYSSKVGRKKFDHVYRCLVGDCTWTTKKSTSLVVHIRKHFGMYPYECKLCGKSFT